MIEEQESFMAMSWKLPLRHSTCKIEKEKEGVSCDIIIYNMHDDMLLLLQMHLLDPFNTRFDWWLSHNISRRSYKKCISCAQISSVGVGRGVDVIE